MPRTREVNDLSLIEKRQMFALYSLGFVGIFFALLVRPSLSSLHHYEVMGIIFMLTCASMPCFLSFLGLWGDRQWILNVWHVNPLQKKSKKRSSQTFLAIGYFVLLLLIRSFILETSHSIAFRFNAVTMMLVIVAASFFLSRLWALYAYLLSRFDGNGEVVADKGDKVLFDRLMLLNKNERADSNKFFYLSFFPVFMCLWTLQLINSSHKATSVQTYYILYILIGLLVYV